MLFHGAPSLAVMDLNSIDQVLVLGGQEIVWTRAPIDKLGECVVAGANRYFTPRRAGRYHFDCAVRVEQVNAGTQLILTLRDLGVNVLAAFYVIIGPTGGTYTVHVSSVLDLIPIDNVRAYFTISNIAALPRISGEPEFSSFRVWRLD
jgi:hypothetical protein